MSSQLNPLKLDLHNRRFYEALCDLNATDVNCDSWLEKFRKVKRTYKVEGKAVLQGWKCFYQLSADEKALPIQVAEKFFGL